MFHSLVPSPHLLGHKKGRRRVDHKNGDDRIVSFLLIEGAGCGSLRRKEKEASERIMNRWLFRSLLALAAMTAIACTVVLLFCWQYRVWSWDDWESYKCMRNECHPVWRDLHAGHIKPGDNVERVIWRTHPNKVHEFEDVKILTYGGGFTGVTIISKNGELVQAGAWSCTWQRTFFDIVDREEWAAFDKRYSAHLEAKRRDRQIEELFAPGGLPVIIVFP